MGLDNIPKNYPCKTRGTAVMVARLDQAGNNIVEDGETLEAIDCDATQACGGCPYKTAYDKSGLAGGAVYGMFGTNCWYRGKYGNFLLGAIGIQDEHGFYGDNEDGTEKSPESCLALADTISDTLDDEPVVRGEDGENITQEVRYAEWWLRWVAEEAGGSICWY